MKRDYVRLLVLGCTICSWPVVAGAQIDGPPAMIDYQGRVLDGLGAPVAAGSTENIEMYFRIWNHISDGGGPNLLWAEKQVVTVADGNFSVRLGEGSPIESSAGDNVVVSGVDDPRPTLLGVFSESERFLGISVAPNSTTKPQAEIQPRLAFLMSPYAAVAETARFAEFGPTNGIFEADVIGIGTSSPGVPLEIAVSGVLAAGDGAGQFSVGPTSGRHIGMDSDDIQGYSNGATPGTLYLNDFGGNVDIGSNGATTSIQGNVVMTGGNVGVGRSPGAKFDVLTTTGGQFRLLNFGAGGGTQLVGEVSTNNGAAPQVRFTGSSAGGFFDIGQNSSGRFVIEGNDAVRFAVENAGRVGVGTASPSEDFHVFRADNDIARVYATGSSQGGGMFYAGQSTSFGGGFLYEGDNNPNVVGDADRTVFYRRDNNTDHEVFSYAYNSSTVQFSGALNGAGGMLSVSGNENTGTTSALRVNGQMLIDANEIDSTSGYIYLNANGSGPEKHVVIADGTAYSDVALSIKAAAGDNWGIWIEGKGAAKPGGGSWSSTSDGRLKKGVKEVRGSLDKLMQLRSVNFRYKEADKLGYEDRVYTGFIAQEAEEVFPDWVSEGPHGFKVISITGFEAHTVQAMRELREEKDAQLEERDDEIADLKARLARLEAMVGELTKTAN